MSVMTRPAVAADAPRIAELLGQLGYPAGVDEVAPRLEYWLADSRSRLLAAQADDGLAGVAALHALPLLEHTGWRGRLVALVVDEGCRGQGVGRALLKAAENAATELGCRDLEITSARDRPAALALYRRLGYVDLCGRAARFVKPL